MRDKVREPDEQAVAEIARGILSFDPVVVVLTGGDPLSSSHLETAVSLLSPHCAVVLDTNGVGMTDARLQFLQQHGVTLRVSLDSEIPAVSRKQRPLADGKDASHEALSAICRGIDSGMTVVVQTVATRWNVSDLAYLGDKLYRIGVHLWRILEVQPSKGRMAGYRLAAGAAPGKKPLIEDSWDHFVHEVLRARTKQWTDGMAVQWTSSRTPNSVILVSPNGEYYTESILRPEKILIDRKSPSLPSLEAIRSHVDMVDHFNRYLGSRLGEGISDF